MWLSASISLYPTLFPSQPLPGACGEDVGESKGGLQTLCLQYCSSPTLLSQSQLLALVTGIAFTTAAALRLFCTYTPTRLQAPDALFGPVALKYRMIPREIAIFWAVCFSLCLLCLLFLNHSYCPLQPTHRCLTSILGKSNLQFAGMTISLTISTSSLNLLASDCKQVRLKRVELARRYFHKTGKWNSALLNIAKSFGTAELKREKQCCVVKKHIKQRVASQITQGLV